MAETRRRPRNTPQTAPPALPIEADSGPVTAVRRPPREAPAPPQRNPTIPRLDENDLLALVQMDPDAFAAALGDATRRKRVIIGARIQGTVTDVLHDVILLNIGDKAEGRIDRAELPQARPGDVVDAFVLERDELGVRLSTRLSGDSAASFLDEAKASGTPVEGKVVARNTGGYEIRIGPVRAFCPASRMSRMGDADPDSFVGQTYQFRVIEGGDRVIVDRRAIQDLDRENRAVDFWATVREGDVLGGTVRRIQPFGAFVDVGAVEGLLPRRAAGWTSDTFDALVPGTTVEVRVERVDRDAKRIEFSMRKVEDDPWSEVGVRFLTGGNYEARIVKHEAFGVFIELAPGLQGLAHKSRFPRGFPKVGEAVTVRILNIDPERRRLELSPSSGEADAAADVPVHGTVSQVLTNGVVVLLSDGRTGWLPAGEVDLPGGTALSQRFRVGRAITARIIAEKSDRITLSQKEHDEAAFVPQSSASTTSFGTLGDLMSKFGRRA